MRIILRHLWGRFGSQVVISETIANGLHIYLFFKRPQVLDRARDAMRNTLQRIQRAYPELERQIGAWNETLRRAGKSWKVRQIGDLEVYPDQKHGFRFIGTRGKVVLADKEIGTVQWGNFARGQHKGQAKYGFDLVAWWKSIQSADRMPREEVERIIESRIPTQQPALELNSEDVGDHTESKELGGTRNDAPAGDGITRPTVPLQRSPGPPGGSIVRLGES